MRNSRREAHNGAVPHHYEYDAGLVWFRRDLRLTDQTALAAALHGCRRVHCAFVFDRAILDPLKRDGVTRDRRVQFIHCAITALDTELRAHGSTLIAVDDDPIDAIPRLARQLGVNAVYVNRDYEPYAFGRDREVALRLAAEGRQLIAFKDQVILERNEILNGSGRPYAVFSAYAAAWRKQLHVDKAQLIGERAVTLAGKLAPVPELLATGIPTLENLGFAAADHVPPASESAAQAALSEFIDRIGDYASTRDRLADAATSGLSVHLRFGTISVRTLVRAALAHRSEGAAGWLNELIWREFFQMILWHHPHVVDRAYRPHYDRVKWESGASADARFSAWCDGRSGYPLVDAAMTQLSATGTMPNRARMVVASFLTKHLGVDWRRGERWFARMLLDYDLASNNGNWQWAAGTGVDAQPYFRIFNPLTQSQRFDPEGAYIRRWLPQLAHFTAKEIHAPWKTSAERQRDAGCVIGEHYPAPIVDHAAARQDALQRYEAARDQAA